MRPLWTAQNILEAKSFFADRYERMFARNKDERLAAIREEIRLAEEGPATEDFLLNKLVHIFLALEHHARHGGMTKRDSDQLLDMATLILRNIGITPGTSKLSFLLADLYRIRSRITRRDGDNWSAAWEDEMANLFDRRSKARKGPDANLSTAELLLRQGFANQAIELFSIVEAASKSSSGHGAARLGKAKALRLQTRWDDAQRLLNELADERLSPEVGADRNWEAEKLGACRSGSVERLFRSESAQETFQRKLEAKLWLLSSPRRNVLVNAPKIESIRRGFKRHEIEVEGQEALYHAILAVESVYDPEVPLIDRAARIGRVLGDRGKLATVEQELLVLAASARALIRHSQGESTNVILSAYRALSLVLSDGAGCDALRLFDAEDTAKRGLFEDAG